MIHLKGVSKTTLFDTKINGLYEKMIRNSFYIFAVAIFLLCASPKILACSCVRPMYGETLETKVNKARNESKAVFTGTVLDIIEDEENHTRTIKLKLLKSWKGELPKEITLVTGWDDGDCGYRFATGVTYLVYAYMSSMYSSDSQLSTNICTRTAVAEQARKDIRVLNRRKQSR